jgi:hypothetical protein
LQDIGVGDLVREDAIYFLGMMAAHGLRNFGQVTLIVGGNDKVCVANPVHVYLDSQAMLNEDLEKLPPFRWVRPVLGSGKPQYCAMREGEMWEIEFLEEDDLEEVPVETGQI